VKRSAWTVAIALALSLGWAPRLVAEPEPIPVIDLHVDLPYQNGYKGASFSEGSGQFRARELLRAGVVGVVLPLFVPKDTKPSGRTKAELLSSYFRTFTELGRTPPYQMPGCVARPFAVETWLSFEGAEPIEPEELEIQSWVLRGVRVFGMIHTEANTFGGSSGTGQGNRGLSARGARFAELVFRAGGIIDVSHTSDRTTDDLIGLAREHGGRIIATHSNARALAPHPRNLTDAQLRAIGELGGVIGVNFHGRFLEPKSGEGSLDDVVRQIRHIARVAGPQAVAIGSDFEGGIRPPAALKTELGYQTLARRLETEGVPRAQVVSYLSGNARRVLCPEKAQLPSSRN
jgi:membrane dipeptidase